MKAVVHRQYGPADDVLSLREIDKPVIGDDDVLVRVRAASMHPDVWHVVEGLPYVLRLMGNGVTRPKVMVPGTDLSGCVESIGKNVTRFKVGDEVFGESTAFGWKNGAGGCVGSLAIQIAKAKHATVTAVDCAEKLPMIRSLGADRVVDYTRENVLHTGDRYDLILDVASTLSANACNAHLTPTGNYVPIGHAHFGKAKGRMGGRIVGSLPYFIGRLLRVLVDPKKRRNFKILRKQDAMATFTALLESGKLTPIVGRTFPLSEVPAAMRCMQEGTTVGRIIVTP